MDDTHLSAAVRYVELNPVRAGLAPDAETHAWSSAKAHCSGLGDRLISSRRYPPLDVIDDWRAFLSDGVNAEHTSDQRRHLETGYPLVEPATLKRLEADHGRPLAIRPRGRPRAEAPHPPLP